ncbi:DUF5753 domain-containing protein [Lentzea sp. NPDC042327]|uniref:DUF5753 domain-containing protein n=1 Tax=Lentzea sp. NPDC042327 TaxID=3154801 RepID=UPI0034075343
MIVATVSVSGSQQEDSSVEVRFSRETARQIIRYQLIHCREVAGVTQQEAADHLGIKQPHYAQFLYQPTHKNYQAPKENQLEELLIFFGAHDRFPILRQVLEIARTGAAGTMHSVGVISDLDMYLALEFFAESITNYEPRLIHTLLQTPQYSRALAEFNKLGNPELDVVAEVNKRTGRQVPLTRRPTPMRFTAFIEERALRGIVHPDPVINAEIMTEQREHIRHVVRNYDNVVGRVLLDDFHLRACGNRQLSLVTFADKWRLAYSESALSAHYFDAKNSVVEAAIMFKRLDEQALPEEASRQFLETVAA